MVKRRKSLSVDKSNRDDEDEGTMTMIVDGRVGGDDGNPASAPVVPNAACSENDSKQGCPDGNSRSTHKSLAVPTLPTRSSSRISKRPRRDDSPPKSPPAKRQATIQKKSTTPKSSKPRPREQLWMSEDKNLFFDALLEFGKDFNAIVALFEKKRKDEAKKKEQIRHFYYRSWIKVSKHLPCLEDLGVPKKAAEIYALVNYGELRKRIGSKLDDRMGQKLNSMVLNGYCVIKIKGKNYRLKTPSCKALKKINKIEETKPENDSSKIPEKVSIFLQPRTNSAWSEIQAMGKNPRLCMTLTSSQRLSSIIKYLQKKWKSKQARAMECLDGSTKESTPDRHLRLMPLEGCKFHTLKTKVLPVQPTISLSLKSFMERYKVEQAQTERKAAKSKSLNQEQKPNQLISDSSVSTSTTTDVPLEQAANAKKEAEDKHTKGVIKLDENPFKLFGANILSGKDRMTDDDGDDDDDAKVDGEEKSSKTEEELELENLEQHRRGWTMDTAGSMTISELCLLLGGPDKVVLEYSWENAIHLNAGAKGNGVQVVLPPGVETGLPSSLTNSLRRLIHLATRELTEFPRDSIKNKPQQKSSTSNALSSPVYCSKCQGTMSPPSKSRVRKESAGQSPSTPKPMRVTKPGSKERIKSENSPTDVLDNSVPSQMASPVTENNVFRVPNPVTTATYLRNQQADRNLMQQIKNVTARPDIFNNMLPYRRKRNNRPIRRQVVVQRNIVPKVDSDNRLETAQLVGYNSETGTFMPLDPQQLMSATTPVPTLSSTTSNASTLSNTTSNASTLSNTTSNASVAATGSITISQALKELDADVKMSPSSTSEACVDSSSILRLAAEHAMLTTDDSSSILTSDNNPVLGQATVPTRLTLQSHNLSTDSSSTHIIIRGSETPGDAAFNEASNMSNRSLNMSSLLDISLPAPEGSVGDSERFIDLALGNSNSSISAFISNGHNKTEQSIKGSITASNGSILPMKTSLIEKDPHWQASEDMSNILSELNRNGTQSSSKASTSRANNSSLVPENSRDSMVDNAVQSLMNESSMDYLTKIAEYAADLDKSQSYK